MERWIVARTHPQRERWASENVARQGAEFYLPRFREEKILKGGVHTVRAACLFPSYLFVRCNGRWHFLLGTFGISCVLMSGTEPASLPDQHVLELKNREGRDGLIRLPKLTAQPQSRFSKGQTVKVIEGAFSGYLGIYEGSSQQRREKVLLDVLGRKTSVLLHAALLEAAE